MSDKPGPLRETVFENENYKLKYSAAQARLFLRLIPFFLSQLHIDWEDLYYQFAIELLEINQLMFSPVISSSGIQHLSQVIEEHLHQFKILFPEKCLAQTTLNDSRTKYDQEMWANYSLLLFCV